jgi:hypothetical protein
MNSRDLLDQMRPTNIRAVWEKQVPMYIFILLLDILIHNGLALLIAIDPEKTLDTTQFNQASAEHIEFMQSNKKERQL